MTKTTYLLTFSCFVFFHRGSYQQKSSVQNKNKNPFLNVSKDLENNITN